MLFLWNLTWHYSSFIGLRVASFFFLPHCVFISQLGSFLHISALLWFCLSLAKGRRSCESEQMLRETRHLSVQTVLQLALWSYPCWSCSRPPSPLISASFPFVFLEVFVFEPFLQFGFRLWSPAIQAQPYCGWAERRCGWMAVAGQSTFQDQRTRLRRLNHLQQMAAVRCPLLHPAWFSVSPFIASL